jgi:ubiquinone/menaquinone biosynthesis C-methylase UbiE
MRVGTNGDEHMVGPYRVIARAHAGRFSVVYRCHDTGLPRDVAVKAIQPDAAEAKAARRQLRQEARLRALIDHPHVLPLYRLVAARAGPLLVGPWLTGGSLHDRAREPMQQRDVLALVVGVGSALDALAAAGWCHGDVSPTNVLFTGPQRGPGGQVRSSAILSDFGTARRCGDQVAGNGRLVVTPHITAPEVWAGAPGDSSSDIYSLGVLVYLALTGVYPYDTGDVQAFADLHRHTPVSPPSGRSVLAGPATDSVVLRALDKAPSARFATGSALASALHTALRDDGRSNRRASAAGSRSRGATRQAAHRSISPPLDPVAKCAGAEDLGRFTATLGPRQEAALRALLVRASLGAARSVQEAELMTMQLFAPPAALLALEATGAGAALAEGPRTVSEIARICRTSESRIMRITRLQAAVGLIGRQRHRYILPPGLAAAYGGERRARTPVGVVGTAAQFWGHLPRWAATGEPFVRMDQPEGAIYSEVTDMLGTLHLPAAQELATALRIRGYVPAGAAVLDVGAGSAVWSLALAAADREVTVTALDREHVLARTRAYIQARSMTERFHMIVGDWRDAQIPDAAFNLVLLANICHLEPGAEVSRLLRRAHSALRSGGAVVVIDTMPKQNDVDPAVLLQDLHLALRTPAGGVHRRERYVAWLKGAGFCYATALPLQATSGRLTALIGR